MGYILYIGGVIMFITGPFHEYKHTLGQWYNVYNWVLFMNTNILEDSGIMFITGSFS